MQTREYRRNYRHKQLEELREYKKSQHCMYCGEDDYRCLDFHHVDPSSKKFSLGSGKSVSFKMMKLELEKCVVLCANCHRKTHQ